MNRTIKTNPMTVPVLDVVGGQVDQLVNKKCAQNIACCQNSDSNAVRAPFVPRSLIEYLLTITQNGNLVGVAVPCVALGSLV